jgi:hypothetical protein
MCDGIFSLKSLPRLTSLPECFLNEFRLEYDPYDCLSMYGRMNEE